MVKGKDVVLLNLRGVFIISTNIKGGKCNFLFEKTKSIILLRSAGERLFCHLASENRTKLRNGCTSSTISASPSHHIVRRAAPLPLPPQHLHGGSGGGVSIFSPEDPNNRIFRSSEMGL